MKISTEISACFSVASVLIPTTQSFPTNSEDLSTSMLPVDKLSTNLFPSFALTTVKAENLESEQIIPAADSQMNLTQITTPVNNPIPPQAPPRKIRYYGCVIL
ncbi:hypothetical protein K7432_009007 [Basidiobolus ranarum]|uniref:Uncharacterized protein n=1 Tax=Basidiobolus ranarum TaxID=34480 RepID=A0ABR2WR04_9FUNG